VCGVVVGGVRTAEFFTAADPTRDLISKGIFRAQIHRRNLLHAVVAYAAEPTDIQLVKLVARGFCFWERFFCGVVGWLFVLMNNTPSRVTRP
jgi:hypothetical protein